MKLCNANGNGTTVIISLLQQKFMAHKSEVLPPTTRLFCDRIT